MRSPAEGCARSGARSGQVAAPLGRATAEPVLCRRCGSRFGRGAEAGTVCPVCGGELRPLSGAGLLADDPAPTDRTEDER